MRDYLVSVTLLGAILFGYTFIVLSEKHQPPPERMRIPAQAPLAPPSSAKTAPPRL